LLCLNVRRESAFMPSTVTAPYWWFYVQIVLLCNNMSSYDCLKKTIAECFLNWLKLREMIWIVSQISMMVSTKFIVNSFAERYIKNEKIMFICDEQNDKTIKKVTKE